MEGKNEEQAPDGGSAEQDERQARYEVAMQHWERGRMGVTAEDHLAIASTPPGELERNPGKTLAELWDEERILQKLNGLVQYLSRQRSEFKEKGPYHQQAGMLASGITYAKKEIRASIPYLRSLGKLPKEFENFEVDDAEGDPKE